MDDGRRADVEQWLRKARDDIAVARMVLQGKGPGAVGCFLCQQAVEKLLKACLVAAGLEPPRMHDLERLQRRCTEAGHRLVVDDERLSALSQYAVAPRYPGFPDDRADEDLPAFVRFAEEVDAEITRVIREMFAGRSSAD